MLWSEKLPFAGYSVVKDQMGTYVPKPLATAPRGPRCPTPPLRGVHVRALIPYQPKLACLAELKTPSSREQRLVENTGLEPVTSWLQTRRSPS